MCSLNKTLTISPAQVQHMRNLPDLTPSNNSGLKWANSGLRWANLGLKWAYWGVKWVKSGFK